MKLEDVKKTKFGLAFVIAWCAMIILSIVVIIVSLVKRATWLMFVYLGLALVYAVCILILEILKNKGEKKEEEEEQPAEE